MNIRDSVIETKEINIDEIEVHQRTRKDFGDLTELKEEISAIGQVNPIWVDKDYVLICGNRRYLACKELGRKTITATICKYAHTTYEALRIEYSENKGSKDWTPSELVHITNILREGEAAQALERKREGNAKGGRSSSAPIDAELKKDRGDRAADRVAKDFGVSASHLRRMDFAVKNAIYPVVKAMDEKSISVFRAFEISKLPEIDQADALNLALSDIKASTNETRGVKTTRVKTNAKAAIDPSSSDSITCLKTKIIGFLIMMRSTVRIDPDAENHINEIIDECNKILSLIKKH